MPPAAKWGVSRPRGRAVVACARLALAALSPVALAPVALALAALALAACPADHGKLRLRLSASASPRDVRATALLEKFGPAVAGFARFEPHWNSTLFRQGTELEAIARGNLEMSITSAQEISVFLPEFSVFAAGYVHKSAGHLLAVFNAPLMAPYKRKLEQKLGVKLLAVMYLGRRHVALRMPRSKRPVTRPVDLSGVTLRMPPSDAWQFLGKALGASPTPMALAELYTALQTGAVDGQDNPLPLVVDAKLYEVTRQIVLTSHLVDLNYTALSRKVWDRLTPGQRATVRAAAEGAAAFGRKKQLRREQEQLAFLRAQGIDVYEPDLTAFRKVVQSRYLRSRYARAWAPGVLDRINALSD